MQLLSLEEDVGYDTEDNKRYYLLNDLELHKSEWTTIAYEADAIGRYLTAILKESNYPRKDYNAYEGPVATYA